MRMVRTVFNPSQVAGGAGRAEYCVRLLLWEDFRAAEPEQDRPPDPPEPSGDSFPLSSSTTRQLSLDTKEQRR